MAHTGEQMYALDATTGAILWRFAAGGSVVAGPAVVRGTVYWGSGYARTGGIGNNTFYAFTLDGRGSSDPLHPAGALARPERKLVLFDSEGDILMSLGMLGLTIELWTPGAVLPGVAALTDK